MEIKNPCYQLWGLTAGSIVGFLFKRNVFHRFRDAPERHYIYETFQQRPMRDGRNVLRPYNGLELFVVHYGGVDYGDCDKVDDIANFGIDVDEVDRLLKTHLNRADCLTDTHLKHQAVS